MTKHTYPKSFLRKKCYHVITDIKRIENCFLIRFSDTSRPYQTVDEFKEKLKYHFGASQILTGISTILLCRLHKHHLKHQVITPKRNSAEDIDVRRSRYFENCTGNPICPIHDDLRYRHGIKYFGIKIKDVISKPLDIEIRDKQKNVLIRTDILQFEVRHTPKRSDFWHCDIVLTGIDGSTHQPFDPTRLDRPEMDSTGKISKKAAAIIAMLEDSICHDEDIKRKKVPWDVFSDVPIGRKAKKA